MSEDSTERLLGKLENHMDSSIIQQTRIGTVLDKLEAKLDGVEEKAKDAHSHADNAHTKIDILGAKINTVKYVAGLISAIMGGSIGWFFKK